jgi:hypothetical protein
MVLWVASLIAGPLAALPFWSVQPVADVSTMATPSVSDPNSPVDGVPLGDSQEDDSRDCPAEEDSSPEDDRDFESKELLLAVHDFNVAALQSCAGRLARAGLPASVGYTLRMERPPDLV